MKFTKTSYDIITVPKKTFTFLKDISRVQKAGP